jgi:hypothetical protein
MALEGAQEVKRGGRKKKEKKGEVKGGGEREEEPLPSPKPTRSMRVERGHEMEEMLIADWMLKNKIRRPHNDTVKEHAPVRWEKRAWVAGMGTVDHADLPEIIKKRKLEAEEQHVKDEALERAREAADGEAEDKGTPASEGWQGTVSLELVRDANALSNTFHQILDDETVLWTVRSGQALQFLQKIPLVAELYGDVDELKEWTSDLLMMIRMHGKRFAQHLHVVQGTKGKPRGYEDLDSLLRQSFAWMLIFLARNKALLNKREHRETFMEDTVRRPMRLRGEHLHEFYVNKEEMGNLLGVDPDVLLPPPEDEGDEEKKREPKKGKKKKKKRKKKG